MVLRAAGGLWQTLVEGLVQLRACCMSLFYSEKQIDGGGGGGGCCGRGWTPQSPLCVTILAQQ